MSKLALLGARGHGKVVAEAAQRAGWQSILFFDDSWPELTANGQWPVIGDSKALLSSVGQFDGVLVAIGNCVTRWDRLNELRLSGAPLVSIVHPHAYVSSYALVGEGSVVLAGAVVSVDATLGSGCIVNTGASVDHDCVLAEGVHISPGAHLSGNVSVGALTWVGIGSCVREGTRIGSGVLVGAGSVVVKDIADGLTVAGNPAVPLLK